MLVKIASKTSDLASLSTRANTVLVVIIMDQITVAHVRQISLAKIASKTSDLVSPSIPARTAVNASPKEVATVALAKGDLRERHASSRA